MGESCVFDCTTASAHTKINAVDKNPKTALKALLHTTCRLSIRPHLITKATKKTNRSLSENTGAPLLSLGLVT
jgi:hypothetical protein